MANYVYIDVNSFKYALAAAGGQQDLFQAAGQNLWDQAKVGPMVLYYGFTSQGNADLGQGLYNLATYAYNNSGNAVTWLENNANWTSALNGISWAGNWAYNGVSSFINNNAQLYTDNITYFMGGSSGVAPGAFLGSTGQTFGTDYTLPTYSTVGLNTNPSGIDFNNNIGSSNNFIPGMTTYQSFDGATYNSYSPDYTTNLDFGSDDSSGPVILALPGNAINITQLSQSNVFFDTTGSGQQHQTAWAGAGNGVLFYDPTGQGKLTQANQYIFTDWDPGATSDMQALEDVFDTNHDGMLDGSELNNFFVMVTNANGTQTGRGAGQRHLRRVQRPQRHLAHPHPRRHHHHAARRLLDQRRDHVHDIERHVRHGRHGHPRQRPERLRGDPVGDEQHRRLGDGHQHRRQSRRQHRLRAHPQYVSFVRHDQQDAEHRQ
jgi:hypothetical protein